MFMPPEVSLFIEKVMPNGEGTTLERFSKM
jgi:hypothetical protein